MSESAANRVIGALEDWSELDHIVDEQVVPPASSSSSSAEVEARVASTMPGALLPADSAEEVENMFTPGIRSTTTAISSCSTGTTWRRIALSQRAGQPTVQSSESLESEYDFCITRSVHEDMPSIVHNGGTLNLTVVNKFYQVSSPPTTEEARQPPSETKRAAQNDGWPAMLLAFVCHVVVTMLNSLLESWVADGLLGNILKWILDILRLFWRRN